MSLINTAPFDELEAEIKQEFFEDVVAAIKDINDCAVSLEAGADSHVIDRMFRSLHTVKGNCKMVFLEPFVEVSHKLEDLFSSIRGGQIAYQDVYGKFAVAIVNRLQGLLEHVVKLEPVEVTTLQLLEQLIERIQAAPPAEQHIFAEKALIAVEERHYNLDLVTIDSAHGHVFSFKDATDLEFFEYIENQKINQSENYQIFISICRGLAERLNARLGQKTDADQLNAAIIYLGLSDAICGVQGQKSLQLPQIFFASGLLSRISGWGAAAELCLQVLENHDGSGGPYSLKNEQILPAAQVLRLAFEFAYTVMANLSSGYKQSLFTAVKQINSQQNSVYKTRLIERFNSVVKGDYLTSQMW